MQQERTFLPFRKAAVLGAGVMGAQIAAHLANAGLEVLLLDIPAKEGPRNSIVNGAFKKTLKMKPAPYADATASRRIYKGNFDDDLHLLKDVEWVVEAIIENLAIKQSLMERVEAAIGESTIITTNTSGLPIRLISEGRSASFKKRFMGTHFFNPPRYLKLLEIIPTPDTDQNILDHISWFGRTHLGKSIVIAKDTPNFIANRIGNFTMMSALRAFTDGDYTIEEVDFLTGPLTGHPKSATFRTADVVGLDTLTYVAKNLYEAVPEDESRESHLPPALLDTMIENGVLGAKTRQGFYKKVKRDILSLNPETMAYEPPKPMDLGDTDALRKAGKLPDRIRAVYHDNGRAGKFFKQATLDLIGYSARRVPEIADNPADIDRAMKWGFAWETGPFERWDIIGFDQVLKDLQAADIDLPDWIGEMKADGNTSFYKEIDGRAHTYIPGQGYVAAPIYSDVINLAKVAANKENVLLEGAESALLDLGDGVALFEFRSKSNTLGNAVVNGIIEAIDFVEQNNFKGMVIGNDGKHFSVGANLGEVAHVLQEGKFDLLLPATEKFQNMVQRIRYARKPVVTALHGMTLGGGCEISLASANVVAALESYVGLVEVGAGLIPAGTGTAALTIRAAEQAPNGFVNEIQAYLMKVFQVIGTARVSTSGKEAVELGLLPPNTRIAMNGDRRIHIAKEEVLRMANSGYSPPPRRNAVMVIGKTGQAVIEAFVYQMQQGNFATEYDFYIAKKLAHVMCGGDISAPTLVDEDYLLKLEREAFVDLLKQEKTQARIKSILTTNKPLRN